MVLLCPSPFLGHDHKREEHLAEPSLLGKEEAIDHTLAVDFDLPDVGSQLQLSKHVGPYWKWIDDEPGGTSHNLGSGRRRSRGVCWSNSTALRPRRRLLFTRACLARLRLIRGGIVQICQVGRET